MLGKKTKKFTIKLKVLYKRFIKAPFILYKSLIKLKVYFTDNLKHKNNNKFSSIT